jgi:glycosyltransferase involved in cell wall biosynthesis
MITGDLVSVVIPTFNHAPLLNRALESVCQQTYPNWEAIVVNNFSTDNTIEVIELFKDSRIKLINFSNNGVIAASRNQGINAASGKYIAFLDSDDKWYPTKLEKCVDAAQTGAQLICHGELWINTDSSTRAVMYGPVKNAKYEKLLFRGNCISTSATFIQTSLLRSVHGFDESAEIVTAEDYELWLRLAEQKPLTVFIPELLGEFHRLANSASSAVLRNLSSEREVLEKHFARQRQTVINQLRMRHRMAIASYGAARQLNSQPRQALKLFLTALLLSPFLFKTYAGLMLLAKNSMTRKPK